MDILTYFSCVYRFNLDSMQSSHVTREYVCEELRVLNNMINHTADNYVPSSESYHTTRIDVIFYGTVVSICKNKYKHLTETQLDNIIHSIPKPTIVRKDKPITSYSLYDKSNILIENIKHIATNFFKKSISLSMSKKISLMGSLIHSYIESRKMFIARYNTDTSMTIYNYCDIFTRSYINDMTDLDIRKYLCNDKSLYNGRIDIASDYTNSTLIDLDKFTSVSKNDKVHEDVSAQLIKLKEEKELLNNELLNTKQRLNESEQKYETLAGTYNKLLDAYNQLKELYMVKQKNSSNNNTDKLSFLKDVADVISSIKLND